MASELITIGEISGVFGVKGWVKLYSHTDPRENILSYTPWILKKGEVLKETKLLKGNKQGKSVVAHLDGISDRDLAAKLIGWEILFDKKRLPKTAKGEYYWSDLVGLQVETDQGVKLGKVDHLIETGANDVLVVKDNDKVERLIPFLQEQVIKKIDLDGNSMIVDWDPNF